MNQYENIEQERITHRFSIKVCNLGSIPLLIHYSFGLTLLIPFLSVVETKILNFPFFIPIFLFLAALVHGVTKYLYLSSRKFKLNSAVMYPFGTYFVSSSEKIILPTNFIGIAASALIPVSYFFFFPPIDGLVSLLVEDLSYILLFVCAANLIPTFPCDSAFFLNKLVSNFKLENSFKYSAMVGQAISCLLLVVSLVIGSVLLALFSVLTLISSISRYVHSQLELASTRYKLADIATPLDELVCLQHGITVKAASEKIKNSPQPSFPVVHGDEVIGIVHKETLNQHIASNLEESYISELMERDFPRAQISASIVEAAKLLKPFSWNAIVVVDNNKTAGIIFEESIAEIMSNPT